MNQIHFGRWKYLPAGHGHQECDSDEASFILDDAYGFDVSRCTTHDQFGQWMRHMSEKDWVTNADLADFARLWVAWKGDSV